MPVDLAKRGSAGVVPLSRNECRLLGAAGAGGVGVGGLGFAVSFDSVSRAAERWGFTEPWMLPAGIDIAIPVFTVANLLLIRMGMPLAWVRWVPWGLTLVTCVLNVASGSSVWAKVAHGTMPLLWVVLSEIAAHVYAVRVGIATGTQMEKIRRSRWFLAFPSTFALWRRMVLWEVIDYRRALELEKARQLFRARLREQYGRGWRRKASHQTRVLLKLGETPQEPAPVVEQQDDHGQDEPDAVPVQKTDAPKPSRPRRQRKTRKPKVPRPTFEEHLIKARELTATWPTDDLKAAPIRKALKCGQERSRLLRDALSAERAQQPKEQKPTRELAGIGA
jgi:hypothetical protein